ncbi:MAG: hypothetical protein J5985_00940, partial [Kiritimatiellae bacterium]|nr:hypothetical protein [Kiritimatiellia bacterium]
MFSKIGTSILLFLTWLCFCAWLVLVCREKDLHPFRDFASLVKKQSNIGRILFGTFFVVMWVFASTKPGGSTNNVPQMLPSPGTGALVPPSSSNHPTPLYETTITSTNTSRTLTGEDLERGFVMTRIGTGESFDFSAPSNATVCANRRATGSVTDWIYVALSNWVFQVGTHAVSRLRVYSFGKIDPLIDGADGAIAVGNWFAPFTASLGIVPEANWPLLAESARPSQLWHCITPSNTLQVTWQNALYNRVTDTPVNVQVEFHTDGRFSFRYDFSRLDCETVTDFLAGASFGGREWTTNALPTSITSMAFYPLAENDAYDQDPDRDGIPTIDELFFHGTDPNNPDTDCDGLTDNEELVIHGSDPLNPYSVSGIYSDGFAVRLGGLDPLSYPQGSTNTVLEHLFYSGTTNGVFAYPQSSEDMAVLEVSVSGSGVGDLIVGGKIVPLVAPPQSRSAPPTPMPPLLVQIVKGETYPLYLRGNELPVLTLHSADFAFGILPTFNTFGHINFPNTVATTPCIHDFNARRRTVHLPMSRDAHLLTCAWQGASEGVTVSNIPPRSATITGNFPARSTGGITYTLSHPDYLFGQTAYAQTVRFCPQLPDPDPEDPAPDPSWYSGDGTSDDGDDDFDAHWCCYWGTCGTWCGCGCDCGNGSGTPSPTDAMDFDENCPTHSRPYRECAQFHETDYTNAVQNVEHLGGVLYIREPPFYEQIHLDVPGEHHNCCPCPDHWTNYVGVAYKSGRLRLLDANGLDFNRTENSCDVNLAGIYPSSTVGDATLAFTSNGDLYRQYDMTVLGVAIKGCGGDLAVYNALNSDFGYPVTVVTNLLAAPPLTLVTNVRLPDGNIHLELADATGQFTVWYFDNGTETYHKLLDTDATPVKDLSMDYWKALMRRASDGTSPELPVFVTSSTNGTAALVFRYWAVIDGKFVQDQAVQRITSVKPPLRLDITRDGSIDDGDSAAWLADRTFYYWVNQDTIRGDWIGQVNNSSPNTGDLLVNGTFDLVNFFPAALDFKPFTDAWGNRVTYTVKPEYSAGNSFNFCFADIAWNQAGSIQTSPQTTLSGNPLSAAPLSALPSEGVDLPYSLLSQFSDNSGLLICEAKSPHVSLEVSIKVDDIPLYTYFVPMTILPVKQMYSWLNFRPFSDENAGRGNEYHDLEGEEYTKSLIFLHGVNVTTSSAEQWGDILFKRLWLSGSRARFYNVDWRGDIGSDANYHQNASNAFVIASQMASTIGAIPGEKVVM